MDKINSIAATTWRWMQANRDWLPSVAVLVGVVAFWFIGLVGGLAMLREAQSPMATLVGLYFMLALIAISITVAILAASDLVRRLAARRNSRQR